MGGKRLENLEKDIIINSERIDRLRKEVDSIHDKLEKNGIKKVIIEVRERLLQVKEEQVSQDLMDSKLEERIRKLEIQQRENTVKLSLIMIIVTVVINIAMAQLFG